MQSVLPYFTELRIAHLLKQDLAVKTEGYFALRYRVFDIFSTPIGHTDRVIQAECYGGVFRVYSTKEFPGLPASTELTKVRTSLLACPTL